MNSSDRRFGQLGLGDTSDRGDAPGEMGDALPAVDLGPGRTANAVAVGSTHACAILDDGSVRCWGRNNIGQLGLGDTDNRGDGAGEMGAALPAVPLGTGRTAVALALGNDHTCARLDDHSLKCWGNANQGQHGGASGDEGYAAASVITVAQLVVPPRPPTPPSPRATDPVPTPPPGPSFSTQ